MSVLRYCSSRNAATALCRLWSPSQNSPTPPLALGSQRSMSARATPRPSASLVVVNTRNEILLVHRNPQAHSFGGMHVFPGGNYDAKQDNSYEMTAIRETFEESGILLASAESQEYPSNSLLDASRESVHAQRTDFRTFLLLHRLSADVSALLPLTQWVTPPTSPRRFHTRFFVAFLPSVPSSDFSSGLTQHRLPTPDGGSEVIAARFLHPADAIAEFHAGKITIMPPQYYILTTLADILRGHTADPEQRQRVQTLSASAFGQMVVNPRQYREPDAPAKSDTVVLTYEGDEVRGGPKGRLHRSAVKFGKGGVPIEIKLFRNFDIFTETEPTTPGSTAKL